MRIDAIQSRAYTPTFKNNESTVPYPELSYRKSRINVYESDPFESGLKSLLSKVGKAYRLLFIPEVDAHAKEIRKSVDMLFDDEKNNAGNKFSTVA